MATVMNDRLANDEIIKTKHQFENIFGNSKSCYAFASPASIILLGDHTHYNDGILISTVINKFTVIVIRKRSDDLINIASGKPIQIEQFSINSIDRKNNSNSLIGLIKIFLEEKLIKQGFDIIIFSDVPNNLGLGKLSSLEVSFAKAIKSVFHSSINNNKLLELIRKSEINNLGKISNIAHLYTSMYGREDRIFCLDTRTHEYNYIDMNKYNIDLIIADTKEEIENVTSTCNERIEECEIGVKGLRLYIWGIKNLRDVEQNFLLKHYHMLPKRIFDRVLYNVNERMRAVNSIKLIKKGCIEDFGKLITESHFSLANEYQLSCDKRDSIIKNSLEFSGILGSKMISCSPIKSTFHLLKREATQEFVKNIKKCFYKKYKSDLEVYISPVSSYK